jgi:hypothetical protein
MADEEKIGKPWNDDELDAIVADYFSMLNAELSRQPYIKSHHSAVLMNQIGRTHRSVEFKHQNISAVLEEMGLPWIVGYKPKRNYQASIFGAIDRYLSSNVDLVYRRKCSQLPTMPAHSWTLRNWEFNPIGLGSLSVWFRSSIPWNVTSATDRWDEQAKNLFWR